MAHSLNDEKVLAFIFDPFLLDAMNNEEDLKTNGDDRQEATLTATQLKAKQLELKAVELANSNQLDLALEQFCEVIHLWPQCASAYNNRAQIYRLKNQIDDAKADLDQAILLSEEAKDELVARQAYCQRALIHLLREDKEQGLRDMSKSATMGNGFAKTYMAKQNPYAALCNQMLREMFEQYRVPPNGQ